jgi:anti-sigma B factor antagonist
MPGESSCRTGEASGQVPDIKTGESVPAPAWASGTQPGDVAMASQRRIDIEDVGDVTVARFVDKKILDENNIQIIGNQLMDLVDVDGRRKIVLDFGNVEYLSSAALGNIVKLNTRLKSTGGKLALCSIRPEIHEIFKITQLHKVINIQGTQEEAVAGM